MKTTLTIRERTLISQVLPKQASHLEMIIVESIHRTTGITPQEIKDYNVKQITLPGGGAGLQWDYEKDTPKEFEFTPEQIEVIRKGYDALDNERGITIELLSLGKIIRKWE